MYFPPSLLGLLFVIQSCCAWFHSNAVCLDSCSEACGYVLWEDSPPNIDYYTKTCKDDLQVRSAFLCARQFCTEKEIEDGYQYVNHETCELYGGFSLAPLTIVENVSNKEIENMPRISYNDVLAGTVFNSTAIPDQEFFDLAQRTVAAWSHQLNTHELYGWAMYIFWAVVMLISLATKLIISLRRKSAMIQSFDTQHKQSRAGKSSLWLTFFKISTYLDTSATFGDRCSEPYVWGNVPPLIQTFTIFAFVAINIVLCSANYSAFDGNLYWPLKTTQIWRYISDRTGIIAFANLPLIWAFGSRNNLLLWLTGWNFTTFNVFHRWVARIATLEAVVHSVAYTVGFFLEGGKGEYYYAEWKERYFYSGVIATICMSLMLGFSIRALRKHVYEFFLLIHIVLALITLVTLFLHVAIFNGQYNGYLWATAAIWCFDRLARVTRVLLLNMNLFDGSRNATAWYSSNSETIYLDVKRSMNHNIGSGAYYYVYLLRGWKFWESHPFTAIPSLEGTSYEEITHQVREKEMSNVREEIVGSLSIRSGYVRFAIRPYGGFTSRLRKSLGDTAANQPKPMRILLEGPYGHSTDTKNFNNHLLLIGGSGITAALSHLENIILSGSSCRHAISIHWSVRHFDAVEEFRDDLFALIQRLNVEITIYITREPIVKVNTVRINERTELQHWSIQHGRMNVPDVVRKVTSGSTGSVAVIGCGPSRMMDECRASVVNLAVTCNEDVQYFPETFGW